MGEEIDQQTHLQSRFLTHRMAEGRCVVSCYEQLHFVFQQATIPDLHCTAYKPNYLLVLSEAGMGHAYIRWVL